MRAVTMPQFLTGKKPTHWLSGLPFTVPQPNQQTHACPPAKPGRNTLLSAPVTHHPQILIQKPPSSYIRVDIFSSVVFLCRILLQKLDRTSLSFCTWIVLFLVVFFFLFFKHLVEAILHVACEENTEHSCPPCTEWHAALSVQDFDVQIYIFFSLKC